MGTVRKVDVGPNDKALVVHSSSPRHQMYVQQAAPETEGLDLDLIDTIQRRWMLALVVFFSVLVLGTLWVLKTMKPAYQAETTILVPPEAAKDSTDGPTDGAYPTLINQEIMTILHYDTLSAAIHQLGKEGIQFRGSDETERQAVDRLRTLLEVQRVPDSYEIAIQMTAGDPKSAATIANTVAKSFLEDGNKRDATGKAERMTALQVEKAAVDKELATQLDLQAKLAQSLQVVNLQKTTVLPDDEVLIQMRQALATAHRKRIEAEEQLAAGQSTVAIDAEQIVGTDPAARSTTEKLLQRQFELRERIKDMLPSHPVRQQAEAELAAIDSELQKGPNEKIPKVTEELMERLRSQAESARRIELALEHEIAVKSAVIPDTTRNLGQAELVATQVARLREQLSRVEGQMDELNMVSMSKDAMRIFSLAQPPPSPVKSQRRKALGVILAAAFVLGLGLPVLLDMRDRRIYDPATVERILGFPVVGITIKPSSKSQKFAEEHLWRLMAGIERGIADGAESILLLGVKEQVEESIVDDVARCLTERKTSVTIQPRRWSLDANGRSFKVPAKLMAPGASSVDEMEGRHVVLMDAPPLMFSAEAERLAVEADMTLLVVRAARNTRADLLRGARLLERLNVPAVGVILQDVQVERAGRLLRRDLREYLALQRQMAGVTRRVGTEGLSLRDRF